MKTAIIRWHQRSMNPKRAKKPMQIENVSEVGEGPHFIHIFLNEGEILKEVNLHHSEVESVTIYEVPDPKEVPSLLDAQGEPISGDEAQVDESLPVEQKDAGSNPVVPAI